MADISTFTDLGGTTYNLKDAAAREAMGKYFALDGGTVIPSGDDLDDYKTPGTYTCAFSPVASGIANTPINVAFRMVVMRVISGTTARLFQIVFTNGHVRFYLRYYGGSSWGGWRRFEFSSYRPGDTFKGDEMVVYPGYDALANNVGFSIIVPKLLTDVSSVAIDTLKLRLCGPSGYITGYSTTQDVMTSGYTVTAKIRGDNLIHINVTHTNLASIARGTCINVVVEKIKLTFS